MIYVGESSPGNPLIPKLLVTIGSTSGAAGYHSGAVTYGSVTTDSVFGQTLSRIHYDWNNNLFHVAFHPTLLLKDYFTSVEVEHDLGKETYLTADSTYINIGGETNESAWRWAAPTPLWTQDDDGELMLVRFNK